jgi:hypothetical protein
MSESTKPKYELSPKKDVLDKADSLHFEGLAQAIQDKQKENSHAQTEEFPDSSFCPRTDKKTTHGEYSKTESNNELPNATVIFEEKVGKLPKNSQPDGSNITSFLPVWTKKSVVKATKVSTNQRKPISKDLLASYCHKQFQSGDYAFEIIAEAIKRELAVAQNHVFLQRCCCNISTSYSHKSRSVHVDPGLLISEFLGTKFTADELFNFLAKYGGYFKDSKVLVPSIGFGCNDYEISYYRQNKDSNIVIEGEDNGIRRYSSHEEPKTERKTDNCDFPGKEANKSGEYLGKRCTNNDQNPVKLD